MMLATLEFNHTEADVSATTPEGSVTHIDAERQLEELIRDHAAAVRDILVSRYRGGLTPADIDDVVAAASQRLWKNRAEFSRLRSPRAWFVRIADNLARDMLRYGWQKARRLEVAAEKDYLESFSPVVEAETAEIDPQLVEKIRTAVESLPENQRKIIWADALSREGNIAAEDLARELDIPTGTVRVYRKRALDKLRKLLTEQGLAPAQQP